MPGQKCILCGKEYPAGLHVLGCLICFPCEKKLLLPDGVQRLSVQRRRRLGQWVRSAQVASSPMIHGCRRLS
jgi:hypothetical protein